MAKYILSIIFATVGAAVFAQEEQDTAAVRELQEIVIQSPKVVRKADADLYTRKIRFDSFRVLSDSIKQQGYQ